MNKSSSTLFSSFLICGALFFFWPTACQPLPEKQEFVAHGVIKGVIANGKGVRIEHDDIPGFMQAMTMDFEVKDPALLARVQLEEEITFTLEKTSTSLYIVALTRVSPSQEEAEAATTRDNEPVAQEESSPEPTTTEFIPYPAANFTLTDQDGRPFSLSDARGKIVLLDFIFTRCPGPCPLLSLKFSQLQKKLGERLGKDVFLLSVSIDPKHDTPRVLKDYAERYEANLAGWKFLTGSTRDIILTATAFGADYKAGAEGIVDHRLLTCIIDKNGQVVKEFTGTNHTVEDLSMEVDQLLS
jgi:protein SCO1/2